MPTFSRLYRQINLAGAWKSLGDCNHRRKNLDWYASLLRPDFTFFVRIFGWHREQNKKQKPYKTQVKALKGHGPISYTLEHTTVIHMRTIQNNVLYGQWLKKCSDRRLRKWSWIDRCNKKKISQVFLDVASILTSF